MVFLKKPTKWMLLLAMGLTITACDKAEEDSATEEEEGKTPGGISAGGVAAGNSDTFSALGAWMRNTCQPAAALGLQDDGGDDDTDGGYDDGDGDVEAEGEGEGEGEGESEGGDDKSPEQYTLTFADDGTMAAKIDVFMDAECATKMAEISALGTYKIGNELLADPATKELDLTYTSSSLTLLTQEVVDLFNGVGMELQDEGEGDEGHGPPCTKTEPWVLNEVVDLSTVDCAADSDMPVAGQVRYEAISIVGDVMKLAAEYGEYGEEFPDGETPETRRVVVTGDEKHDFVKQATAE